MTTSPKISAADHAKFLAAAEAIVAQGDRTLRSVSDLPTLWGPLFASQKCHWRLLDDLRGMRTK